MTRARTHFHGTTPRTLVDGVELIGLVPPEHVEPAGANKQVIFNDDGVLVWFGAVDETKLLDAIDWMATECGVTL